LINRNKKNSLIQKEKIILQIKDMIVSKIRKKLKILQKYKFLLEINSHIKNKRILEVHYGEISQSKIKDQVQDQAQAQEEVNIQNLKDSVVIKKVLNLKMNLKYHLIQKQLKRKKVVYK
jgi:hypothetical protein